MHENEPAGTGRPRLPGDPFFREQIQRRRERMAVGLPFWEDIPGLLAYPVRAGGWIKIALSSVFFAIIFFILKSMAYFGPGGILLALILSTGFIGYILNFLLSVTQKTTTHPDDSDPPDWPDFRGFLDQAYNFAVFFAIMLVPIISPPVAYAVMSWSVSWSPNPLALGLILLPGFLYTPMAVLVFAVTGSAAGALNPIFVLRSIFNCGGPYFAALPFMFMILAMLVVSAFVSELVPFSSIVFYSLGFYFSMASFRLLGLLYIQCQVRLGWFDEDRKAR